jgi:hypothetical protein
MMPDEERHEEVGYAAEALPRGLVLRLLAATVIISVALCVIAYLLLRLRESALRPTRSFPEKNLPAPHEVSKVLAAPYEVPLPVPALKDRQRTLVDTYGWVDRQKRVVRIPVRRAMELMLQRQGTRPAGAAP